MSSVKNDINFEENIINADYSDIMSKSYIDYSMSVITARAVPDVRDGLKPVHRRIIFDMGEQGITHNKPYKKSARVVGSVMGNYHPHGDSSIYDAAVVMAQEWKKGFKLIDGHGNFGSIEGDPQAASRYTEMRLEKFTEDTFLSILKDDTVDFAPNYDETQKEPIALPCLIPNLLINGSEGIAVGMATSIPTHNLNETIDAAVYLLEHPKAEISELLNILQGPDFPTGGIVANKKDLLDVYSNGSGKIRLRGKVHFEKGTKGGKDKLVVTEIPYTMIGDGISKFLQDVGDLVEDRTLPDVVDILNQSSKEGMRLVLELKKDANHNEIENILYKKTRLEDTFGVNMLAISSGRPEVFNLKTYLEEFLCFQNEIYTRRFNTLLQKANKRLEINEGLIKAIDVIDTIIEIVRGSNDVNQARDCLMFGKTTGITFKTKTAEKQAKTLNFSEIQANAILELKLSRLVGLELDVLNKEHSQLLKDIARFKKLLSSKTEMKKEIKSTLEKFKKEYSQKRRTLITDCEEVVLKEKEEAEIPVIVLVDRFGYIHSVDKTIYDKNPVSDYKWIIETTNKSKIGVFTNAGQMHSLKVKEIPNGKVKDKGSPLDNISNYDSKNENIINIVSLDKDLLFVSNDGFAKLVPFAEFNVTRKTIQATSLNEKAKLLKVIPIDEKDRKSYVGVKTENGLFSRFKLEEIPSKKKTAIGVVCVALNDDKLEEIVVSNDLKNKIAHVELGKIKLTKRGSKGVKMK